MYLSLDAEFGGIGNQYSLLSAYFLLTDDKFVKVDDLYLLLKPNDGIYHVCGEAMSINQINLIEHDKVAITYKEGGTALYKFLKSHYDYHKNHFISVGHGMSGDLTQIFDKLVARNTWETFVSYRRLDTSVALQFLKSCGLFPEEVSGSLESLIQYFGIKMEGNLHDAKNDTLATVECLKRLIEMVNSLQTLSNQIIDCG